MNVTLRWLEACDYKIAIAVSAVEGGSKPQSLLSQYFEQTRDKQVRIEVYFNSQN